MTEIPFTSSNDDGTQFTTDDHFGDIRYDPIMRMKKEYVTALLPHLRETHGITYVQALFYGAGDKLWHLVETAAADAGIGCNSSFSDHLSCYKIARPNVTDVMAAASDAAIATFLKVDESVVSVCKDTLNKRGTPRTSIL